MEYFLGIDIGGTNVKVGLVSSEGELLEKRKYPTAELRSSGNFSEQLLKVIGRELEAHDGVQKVGIGVPGTITKDRLSTLELANLSELNGLPIVSLLGDRFPQVQFFLENDANAAALGELYFAQESIPDTFLFITLGTGVGSAAVIDRAIFKGGDGNAMELGHIICGTGKTVEQEFGKAAILTQAKTLLPEYPASSLHKKAEKEALTPKHIVKAAQKGDPLAVSIFKRGGKIVAEGLIGAIRILDIKTVLIGGGVSKTYPLLIDPLQEHLRQHLTPYYTNDLEIRMATLGNDAGIIGAASLCFIEE